MEKDDKEENEIAYEAADGEDNFGIEPEIKIKKLKEELKECHQKAAEFLAGWQRAKADLINSRKDEEKARKDIINYANERLLCEMLNVLDSFEKALLDPGIEGENKSGLRHIHNQLLQIMRGYEIYELEAVGQKFNPSEHESIMEGVVSKSEEDQMVLEEIQKGYKMYDKILRPAKVKVGIYKPIN